VSGFLQRNPRFLNSQAIWRRKFKKQLKGFASGFSGEKPRLRIFERTGEKNPHQQGAKREL